MCHVAGNEESGSSSYVKTDGRRCDIDEKDAKKEEEQGNEVAGA